MSRPMLHALRTLAFTLGVLIAVPAPAMAAAEGAATARAVVLRPMPAEARQVSLPFGRTDLYFGTLKPGGVVTEAEFFEFLDAEVTPRFPSGLTVLRAIGQFRGQNGVVIREDSFILILLYPLRDARQSSRDIDAIRELYKEAFEQESVLRVDDRQSVRVSF